MQESLAQLPGIMTKRSALLEHETAFAGSRYKNPVIYAEGVGQFSENSPTKVQVFEAQLLGQVAESQPRGPTADVRNIDVLPVDTAEKVAELAKARQASRQYFLKGQELQARAGLLEQQTVAVVQSRSEALKAKDAQARADFLRQGELVLQQQQQEAAEKAAAEAAEAEETRAAELARKAASVQQIEIDYQAKMAADKIMRELAAQERMVREEAARLEAEERVRLREEAAVAAAANEEPLGFGVQAEMQELVEKRSAYMSRNDALVNETIKYTESAKERYSAELERRQSLVLSNSTDFTATATETVTEGRMNPTTPAAVEDDFGFGNLI